MRRAVTLGETMALFRSSEIGRLENQSFMALGFGGAESNVAIGLARFGIETTWISRLGDDALGNLVRDGIRGQGVQLFVERDPEHSTGLMVREVLRRGQSNVFYYRANSAASQMQPELVERFDWSDVDLFHSSGITSAISSSAAQTVLKAFQLAKKSGATCSLDINFRSKLISPHAAVENLHQVIGFLDYLFGSEEEILLLSNAAENAFDVAKRLAKSNNCTVVIKRAENGAIAVTASEVIEHAGRKVSPVDSVGAGDAFVAAFLASVLQGEPLVRCLEVAHEFGAMSVLAPGDWESQPDPKDLFRDSGDVSR